MNWVKDQSKIHITIGSVPQTKREGERVRVDFDTDLQMVKAALLYGDRATICGASSSALLALLSLGDTPKAQRFAVLKTINSLASDEEAAGKLTVLLELYEKVRRRRYTREGERLLRKFNTFLDEALEDAKNLVHRIVSEAGGDGIVYAVDSGLLEIHEFESPLRRLIREEERREFLLEFINVVSDVVSDVQTYPLFDQDTSELISAGISEGLIPVSGSAISRGKEIGLTADLISRLPVFPRATVKEILDIRSELQIPLLRFRAGMIRFSENIKNASWDKEFAVDAELVFRRDVVPAVLDIEAAVESNRFLSELALRLVEKPLATGTVTGGTLLSALAIKMSNLPIAAVAAIAAGPALVAGSVVYDTYNKWREKQKGIQGNSLFFYYRASELLSEGKYEYSSDKS
jgi:hypothetical protein